MAKVTEQDLLGRGFKKSFVGTGNSKTFFYKRKFKHKLLKGMEIIIDKNLKYIYAWTDISCRPLTTANLDLFIRFAEGKKL